MTTTDSGYESYQSSGEGNGDAEQAAPAGTAGPEVAAPGPHPHEAADIRRNAGDVSRWPDPLEGFQAEG